MVSQTLIIQINSTGMNTQKIGVLLLELTLQFNRQPGSGAGGRDDVGWCQSGRSGGSDGIIVTLPQILVSSKGFLL